MNSFSPSPNPSATLHPRRGVYFVANDRILELTLAFLNSFRAFNPDTELCLIPFRSDIQQLESWSQHYRFSIFQNAVILQEADAISMLYHPEVTGHYRKLACWQGPFDEFIYIDVDMVVLKDLGFAFHLLDAFDCITSCSNIPESEQWVWKPTIYDTDILTKDQITFAANTGFIISGKKLFQGVDFMQCARQALVLKPHMELFCKEQPLLNYLIVTSGGSYTSLFALMDTEHFPQNYMEYWAGNGRKQMQKDLTTMHLGKPREIFLIHWAGVWQLKRWEVKMYILLNFFKMKKKIWSISLFMPLRRIWRDYRYR